MPKSIVMRSAALAPAAVALWLHLPSEAAAQPASLYVSAVDLQIAPASVPKFLAALQSDGSAMIKEPGAHAFDIAVAQKDPGHVFVFEAYDNAAAYDAHQKTAAYGKFIASTMMLIKNYDIRPFTSVAMNSNGAAAPGQGPFLVNRVEFDVASGQVDKFTDAAKASAAAAVQEAGCREFDIAVSQDHANHVLLFAVFDNAAALDAHQATGAAKTFESATAGLVSKRDVTPFASAALLRKEP